MRSTRRHFLVGTAASLVIGSPRISWADQHAIEYWHHFTSQSELAGLARVMDLFKVANPDLPLNAENIPNTEYMAKISSAILANARPDAAMVLSDRLADLTAMHGLIDLTDRVGKWTGKKRLPENRWEGLSSKGRIYAVPAFAFVDWMYYRADYFQEAGISDIPKTFDEFLNACRKLTDPSKGRYGFGMRGGAGGYKYVIDMMEAYGSPIIQNGAVAMDRAAAVEAISFYTNLLVKEKVVPPSAPSDGYRQTMEAFRTGQTAMVWHHTGSLREISASLQPLKQFSTAAIPAGPAAHIARVAYAGNGIMKQENSEEAWKWISFWGDTEPAIALLDATGYFPASSLAAEDPRIKGNPIYAPATATMAFGRLPNNFVGVAEWSEKVVGPAFQEVLIGQSTPAQAVDKMMAGLEAVLR